MRKSNFKIFAITFAISFAIAAIIISIQTSAYNKELELNFESLQERTCRSILKSGYEKYVLQNDADFADALASVKGYPLTDEDKQKQFRCFISNMNEGINSSKLEYSGNVVVSDAHAYFDSEMNSIMNENTLMLIVKNTQSDSDDSKRARYYYTYQDDSLTEQMRDIFHKYGNRVGTVVFEVQGCYIKEDTFVPEKMLYYSMGEGGSKSSETVLYTTAKSKDEMEKNGYQYCEIDDAFLIGDITDSSGADSYIMYCSEIDDERKTRVNELINEARNWKGGSVDGRTFIKKKDGLFTSEFFSLAEFRPEGGDELYYAVTYEKKNSLFDLISNSTMGGHGLLYAGLIIIEILGAIVVAVVAAIIIIRVKNKRNQAK